MPPSRRRVRLREPSPRDVETTLSWISEAVGAVAGRTGVEARPVSLEQLLAEEPPQRRVLMVTRRERKRSASTTDSPVGIVVLSAHSQEPVRIEALAIAASERNLGYGAEAVYELEDLYRGHRLVAAVPSTNGLAIYFWLRVGYRPVFATPLSREFNDGRVWMVRGSPP
jgi:hypothetical protein